MLNKKFSFTISGIVGALIAVFVVIIIIIVVIAFYKLELVSTFLKGTDALWYFITAIATMVVAWIAYYKFGKIEHVQKTAFLMQIDERWHSKEILEARIIIHRLYKESSPKQDKEFDLNDVCEKVGNKIKEMSNEGNGEKNPDKKRLKNYEEFITILNLLDFMETIGLMHEEGQVSTEQLEALCGESLGFNYLIFKPYIEHKRDKHKNNEYYKHFEKLHKEIQKRKN